MRKNEPVGPCTTCDAQCTGLRALEGKKIENCRVKARALGNVGSEY